MAGSRPRKTALIGAALVTLLALLAACSSPTPTPAPTATPTSAPQPTQPMFEPSGGPSFIVYDDSLFVELIAPERVRVGEEVLFQMAFANVGDDVLTFYHRADLAEFIFLKDGEQVMTSHDQLQFGNLNYENRLGPGQTRRWETGFTEGGFLGVLIDAAGQPLPPGAYEVHGIARMSSADDGAYEEYATANTTFEIVAP